MGIIKEFREFAVKGNVFDMAVGIIIGAAFGKIVASLVGDIIMPSIGLIVGGVDFTTLKVMLKEGNGTIPPVYLSYGKFIQTVVDFVIIAFSMFMVIKSFNTFKRKQETGEVPPAEPSNEEKLLMEIRDAIKEQTKQ
ncbi:MAG: large-conductance mechanosensitive channel protein MscL [Bacteroidota bacterium]|jgi:large conductance mechanosensitive channel